MWKEVEKDGEKKAKNERFNFGIHRAAVQLAIDFINWRTLRSAGIRRNLFIIVAHRDARCRERRKRRCDGCPWQLFLSTAPAIAIINSVVLFNAPRPPYLPISCQLSEGGGGARSNFLKTLLYVFPSFLHARFSVSSSPILRQCWGEIRFIICYKKKSTIQSNLVYEQFSITIN